MRDIENRRRISREWYLKNKDITKERAKAHNQRRISEIKAYVDAIKSTTPCADCNVIYHPVCMDFDHTGDDKVDNVARMITRFKSLAKVKQEIAKCQLVCSNCHRLRTLGRLMERQQSHTL